MTVAIVAISPLDRIIVSVSDKMISFDDVTQATDDAATKSPSLTRNWWTAFAGNNINIVWPIIFAVRERLKDSPEWDASEVKDIFSAAYAARFHAEFVSERLIKYGYKTIEEFTSQGRANLGENAFRSLCNELDMTDLGAEFIVFGYGRGGHPHIFEVSSPGRVRDKDILGYTAIGSGFNMALASLRRKPPKGDVRSTLYRCLEAKFSAETATGVGEATTGLLINNKGSFSILDKLNVGQIRDVWLKTIRAPDPADALELISNFSGVENVTC